MSEDEIIEYLKNCLDDEFNFKNATRLKDKQAIQGLLDLYKKEKEKNKELENADLTTVYMNGFYDGEKKWKDKIKVKIEEYKKMLETLNKAKDIDTIKAINERLIGFQELLEERN